MGFVGATLRILGSLIFIVWGVNVLANNPLDSATLGVGFIGFGLIALGSVFNGKPNSSN